MSDKPLKTVGYHFAVRIVKLAQKLQTEKKEFVLSNEVLKSGANIGALLAEAELEPNSEEFQKTMLTALKEAKRTLYWLCIIEDTGLVLGTIALSMKTDCEKVIERIELARSGVSS